MTRLIISVSNTSPFSCRQRSSPRSSHQRRCNAVASFPANELPICPADQSGGPRNAVAPAVPSP
ncbi:hypothetical protein OUZ56_030282 [Daphnia magna]|uniref:Uncharacterized protein n=1 Tax=Daphnia magna TaxID=35525 RepID=A0ABQ9ZQU4_9CRUS|nr:hypothetical protein OUZ56_030282 [Daphnia magna]